MRTLTQHFLTLSRHGDATLEDLPTDPAEWETMALFSYTFDDGDVVWTLRWDVWSDSLRHDDAPIC